MHTLQGYIWLPWVLIPHPLALDRDINIPHQAAHSETWINDQILGGPSHTQKTRHRAAVSTPSHTHTLQSPVSLRHTTTHPTIEMPHNSQPRRHSTTSTITTRIIPPPDHSHLPTSPLTDVHPTIISHMWTQQFHSLPLRTVHTHHVSCTQPAGLQITTHWPTSGSKRPPHPHPLLKASLIKHIQPLGW